jgi:hypothetical protein
MPDRGAEFDAEFWTPVCGAALCGCPCHASCPVTITRKRMTVPVKTWYTSCTCPGADQERQRLDAAGIEFRDFSDVRAEARRHSRARKAAFTAARAGAAGQSREQVRASCVAELKDRGVQVPAAPVLEAIVDRIKGNPRLAARVFGENLVQLGKGLYELSRLFRQRR